MREHWRRWVGVGVLLPLVAAAVLVWSVSGRQDKLDRIPVAVVNDDTILTSPQPMAAGRALTASLTDPSSSASDVQLDWTLTDQKDATEGLRSGAYYAVLTIPSDFSTAIISSGTTSPEQGQVTLVSNSAASSTLPYISRYVVAAATGSLGEQTTQGYLKNVYAGFNKIAKSNSSAADSASKLADATTQVSEGAAQLDQGATELAGSLDQVASGAGELAAGTQSVESGAVEVEQGVSALGRGARQVEAAAGKLARSSRGVAGASEVLAGSSRELARGATREGTAVHRLSLGTRLMAADLTALSALCSPAGGGAEFCAAVTRARDRQRRLAAASELVDAAAGGVAASTQRLSQGAGELAGANRELARGATRLSGATDELSSSTGRLQSGATAVAQGAGTVDGAARSLAGGTEETAEAATSLASGSDSVSSGAASTDQGAHQLSSGLANGAKQSPTYSDSLQDSLATVVSQPVDLTADVQHTQHGNGWLLAAIVAVILWLGALVAVLGASTSAGRRLALAPVGSRRIAVAQAVPVMGLAVVQALVVVAVALALGAGAAATTPFALLCLLASATFALLAYAVRLAFGGVGIAFLVLFLLVQVAALGNVIPLETAPGPIQGLNALLPLTAFTNAASRLVAGGDVGSLTASVLVLLAWALAAFAGSVLAVKRQRVSRPASQHTVYAESAV